jgi:cell division protein FtsA
VGAGTTNIAIFSEGAIKHTAVIPIAGDQVTNDIAMAFRTPTDEANQLKLHYGSALAQLVNPEEEIEVASVGDRPPRRLSVQALANIVEPRYEELFILVNDEVQRSGLKEDLGAGVVITGGAASILGAVELAEEIFHLPVRYSEPDLSMGMNEMVRKPAFSTAVGLLHCGSMNFMRKREHYKNTLPIYKPNAKGVGHKMMDWFKKHF